MKVEVWIYIQSQGDGSCVAQFFSTEDEAEEFAEKDEERLGDDIYSKTLEFNSKGKLMNPSIRDEDD